MTKTMDEGLHLPDFKTLEENESFIILKKVDLTNLIIFQIGVLGGLCLYLFLHLLCWIKYKCCAEPTEEIPKATTQFQDKNGRRTAIT